MPDRKLKSSEPAAVRLKHSTTSNCSTCSKGGRWHWSSSRPMNGTWLLLMKIKRPAPRSLNNEFIPNPVHRQQMLRFISRIAQLFAELHDNLIQRARGAVVIVAPNLIQKSVAREHFARMRVE